MDNGPSNFLEGDAGLQDTLERIRNMFRLHGRVHWEGQEWQLGPEPMRSYLEQHPRRKAALFAEVPESSRGIRLHYRLTGDQLWLDRVSLVDDDDPLTNMLLWRALFPGLRQPLFCWWVNGKLLLSRPVERNYMTGWFQHGRSITKVQQVLTVDDPPVDSWRNKEFNQWPLLAKIALVPLALILLPAATIFVAWQYRREKYIPFFRTLLYLPIIMLYFFVDLFLPGRIDPTDHALLRPLRKEIALRKLLNEAFEDR